MIANYKVPKKARCSGKFQRCSLLTAVLLTVRLIASRILNNTVVPRDRFENNTVCNNLKRETELQRFSSVKHTYYNRRSTWVLTVFPCCFFARPSTSSSETGSGRKCPNHSTLYRVSYVTSNVCDRQRRRFGVERTVCHPRKASAAPVPV